MPKTKTTEELKREFHRRWMGIRAGNPSFDWVILHDDIWNWIESKLQQQEKQIRKERMLELAEAQLLGFCYGTQNRDDISGLVRAMGLTKKEWIELNKKFNLDYLTDVDRVEILVEFERQFRQEKEG